MTHLGTMYAYEHRVIDFDAGQELLAGDEIRVHLWIGKIGPPPNGPTFEIAKSSDDNGVEFTPGETVFTLTLDAPDFAAAPRKRMDMAVEVDIRRDGKSSKSQHTLTVLASKIPPPG